MVVDAPSMEWNPQASRYKCCCACCHVKTGTFIIAILELIYVCFHVATTAIWLTTSADVSYPLAHVNVKVEMYTRA